MTDQMERSPFDAPRRGVFGRLYHGETRFDFVGRWKVWFAASAAVLLIGLAVLGTRGLNLGIDFTGGTVWQVPAGGAQVVDVQDAMADLGYGNVQVQEVTQGDARNLRVIAEDTAEAAEATTEALEAADEALASARGDLDDELRPELDAVRENLGAIDGPFAEEVPAPLAGLIEGAGTLGEGDASAGLAEARGQVEELADLQAEERTALGREVSARLAELTGSEVEDVVVDTVGPSWGEQITNSARNALVVFMIAITLFITLRFEWRMALATVVALFHDLLLVVGLYALSGLAVTPATVVALLTMLGFSIYDGIVVFDRVDENTETMLNGKVKHTYSEVANLSLNQVLMRSLNTSITTLLPIGSVLVIGSVFLGATTLQEFGVALFLGLLAGAYSSIFIATPLLALLKEREPQYRDLRKQIASQGYATITKASRPDHDDDPVMTSVRSQAAVFQSGKPASGRPKTKKTKRPRRTDPEERP